MRKFTQFVGALVMAAVLSGSLAMTPVSAQGIAVNETDASSACALIKAALIFIGELPDSRGIQKLELKLQEMWIAYQCV